MDTTDNTEISMMFSLKEIKQLQNAVFTQIDNYLQQNRQFKEGDVKRDIVKEEIKQLKSLSERFDYVIEYMM